MTPTAPEVWLRGPVAGVPDELQPVAHALLQAREEIGRAAGQLGPGDLWASPGGAATPGFHLLHMAGSLDRLLTYARGEPLREDQKAALAREGASAPEVPLGTLLDGVNGTIERALAQLRSTPAATLGEARAVGRAGLPSTVRGLLGHAAEHTARHTGQLVTTVKVLAGLRNAGTGPSR